MEILRSLDDDLPCPPSSTVDANRYYEAFIKAEAILEAAPKVYRDTAESRLPELTSHLYRGGDETSPLYRRRQDAAEILTALWLSEVRQTAGWLAAANAIPSFTGLEKSVVSNLPRKFADPATLKEVAGYLSTFGVVLVWERAIPSMKLDGVIFRIASGQVVIGLSLRYSRLDYFWFTLLHELAHAVLHAEKLDRPIIDDLDAPSEELVELQADRLALDSLVPRNEWRSCPARFSNSLEDIVKFAKQQGIPEQCVAGRLRRELNRFDLFSEIINKHDVRDVLNGR